MTNDTLLYDIGLVDYQTVWDYQLKLFDQIVGMKQDKLRASTVHTTPNVLIWVSHPHVYTLGKSGDGYYLPRAWPIGGLPHYRPR
jgi:lipoyl(octanoyl) transferase